MSRGFLLDTCAVIWMTRDDPIDPVAASALSRANDEGQPVFVSPVTAWELGMLTARRRIAETKPVEIWYEEFCRTDGLEELPLTADVLIKSSFLPGAVHKDPYDRILIATARERGLTIVTRDKAILAYGAAGHVSVMAC
jgi:PIN domain nuclease of toxin-antitoxin system